MVNKKKLKANKMTPKKRKSDNFKYSGEFYSRKGFAEIAKKDLIRKGYKVRIKKAKPTKEEIKKHKESYKKYLGFKPKKAPTRIYRIYKSK